MRLTPPEILILRNIIDRWRVNESGRIGDDAANLFGRDNIANGSQAGILAGQLNEIDNADFAFIGAGNNNTITDGTSAAILAGGSNEITKDLSTILNGEFNQAHAPYTTLIGSRGHATINGQQVHAYDSLTGQQGGSQFSRLLCHATTTDATPTNATPILYLQDNQTWTLNGRFLARRVGTVEIGEWSLNGLISRDVGAATTTLIRSIATPLYRDDLTWMLALAAETTFGSLQLQVTGAAAKNINWFGYLHVAMLKS